MNAVPTSSHNPVLIVNLRSGGGKAERSDLATFGRARGIEPIVLEPGDDLSAIETQRLRQRGYDTELAEQRADHHDHADDDADHRSTEPPQMPVSGHRGSQHLTPRMASIRRTCRRAGDGAVTRVATAAGRLQAVHQLHKRRSHNLFPEPVRALSIGFVWNWPDIDAWARKTGRHPPKDDDR